MTEKFHQFMFTVQTSNECSLPVGEFDLKNAEQMQARWTVCKPGKHVALHRCIHSVL